MNGRTRMMMIILATGLLSPCPLPWLAQAKGSSDPSSGVILLRKCVIEYEQSALLAAPVASTLQDRLVRRGDRVKAGQVLGRLFDQELRAEMEQMEVEAGSDVHVRASEAEYEQLQAKLRATQALSRRSRSFVSDEEFRLDSLAVEKARLALEDARLRHRLAQISLRRAQAQVRAREFVSPFDGVVIEVFKNQGESVSYNEPVFRVVNTGLLRVTGYLNVGDAWRVQPDQDVRITPEVAGVELRVEAEAFPGRVVFVDSQIDPETQTCKVIAEVTNRDGQLRAGLEGRMEIPMLDEADARHLDAIPEDRPAPPGAKPKPVAGMGQNPPADRRDRR